MPALGYGLMALVSLWKIYAYYDRRETGPEQPDDRRSLISPMRKNMTELQSQRFFSSGASFLP